MSKSKSKVCFIDFEFNRVSEPKVNLVCATVLDYETGIARNFWLHNNERSSASLAKFLENYDTIIGYACVAEGRSLLALDLNPLKWKWIDLFFEWRCLTNHNDRLQWGKNLVDGVVKFTKKPPPKWERTESDKGAGFSATHSLAECTYKLTGEIRDTKHKNEMRDLIISDPESFDIRQMAAIQIYCAEDVVFLPVIYERMLEEYKLLDPKLSDEQLRKDMELRGRYAALTALMESTGYPINVPKTRNFSDAVPFILLDVQKDINRQFPDIRPFRWNKKTERMVWNQGVTKAWVQSWIDQNLGPKNPSQWVLTDKKQLSLSLDAFSRFFPFKHDYPEGNFGAQMVRFLKLKQNIYGFVPSADPSDKTFWSSVGSDGRVRPYTNPFKAQSSRSQPGSKGFLFLKPAWMRALCEPEPGTFMGAIDFGSQEYLIQAIDAGDENMIEAYRSGDPYLYLGKAAGAIPPEGTKATHGEIRDSFKQTTLGISFLMSKYGLAVDLSSSGKRTWTEDEAQEMIDTFYEEFSDLKEYQEHIVEQYQSKGHIRLYDGWYIWGDNDNHRSVTNVPTQGKAAGIMRRAVDLCYANDIKVLKTLHDALYMQAKIGEEWKMKVMADCMRQAFVEAFPLSRKADAALIRLDPMVWSPEYGDKTTVEGIPAKAIYIDGRSKTEYERFKKYFEQPEDDIL